MKIIDLSMPLHTGMKVYPNDPEVKIDVIHTYEKDSWELRHLSMGSHTGTHVDAFSHMHDGAENLDDLSLDNFFGQAQIVNLQQQWPQETGLFFIEEVDATYLNKFLVANPKFVGGNLTEELERALLGNKIVTYTGLVNLGLLPKSENFMFYGFPLKIQSGDGSPVRAIAILE